MTKTKAMAKIKESEQEDEIQYFYGATTFPDRTTERLEDGTIIKGEILDKAVLEEMATVINDTSKMGGEIGSYRTVSLFHDKVRTGDMKLEEAGFIVPNTAKVEELEKHPGHYGLRVGTKVNKFYQPQIHSDYTPDKIQYKIDNGVIGLSMEYNNDPDQEHIIDTSAGKYRYVTGMKNFTGFSYARADVIGNPTAVSIKEIQTLTQKIKQGGNTMAEKKPTELETKLKESEDKIQALTLKIKELETNDSSKDELAKVQEQLVKTKETVEKFKLEQDETATKIKESIERAFDNIEFKTKSIENPDKKPDMKLKEVSSAIESGLKTKSWEQFVEVCDTRIKEQQELFNKQIRTNGIDLGDTSMKVKCVGRNFVIDTAEMKTKDVIDSGSMPESTYYQTNQMFADKYVPGITETFNKSDNLLSAMVKIPHSQPANDKYQWRIWTTFGTFTGDNTKAVNPDITAVSTTAQKFLKLESPIREYREAVEVTDFTQHHSMGAVGDLLMQEASRSADVVVNSMDADLFKGKCDATSGWYGMNGLLAYADYSTYTTIHGRVRSSYEKLYNANAYNSTAEAISIPLIREGYAHVASQGTNIADMGIVMHEHQWIRVLNTQDNTSATYNSTISHPVTMATAPAEFGFRRDLIPHIDGIPVILDSYCVDASGNADTFAVIDMSAEGFVLVTSKPLGLQGLAKVGTTEKVYVSWYGTAVLKRPNNLYLHDDLTLLGA